ncbi:MAG TPA: PHB depolymerase family esterase, partial [Gemmatimonadaceae bacterium]|nr:PHB depolymerase family esterase [Gemmatimonadaceae bacterium]
MNTRSNVNRMVLLLAAAVAVAAAGSRSGAQRPATPPPAHAPAQQPAQVPIDGFVARDYRGAGVVMPYRLFVPPMYDVHQAFPLVVWLHGAGGMGSDNLKQISGDQTPGTHAWTTVNEQAKHPSFVLAPQTTGVWNTDGGKPDRSPPLVAVLAIVRALEREYKIDPRRVYIAGQSIGGGGTWTLITSRPTPFAAAIVVCGVTPDTSRAVGAAAMPVWVFQGDQDYPGTV